MSQAFHVWHHCRSLCSEVMKSWCKQQAQQKLEEKKIGCVELKTALKEKDCNKIIQKKGGGNECLEELWVSRKTVEGGELLSPVLRNAVSVGVCLSSEITTAGIYSYLRLR